MKAIAEPDPKPVTALGRTVATLGGGRTARVGVGAATVVVLCAYGLGANAFYLNIGDLCLIAMIGAIGLNLLTGYAGQVSVGSAPLLAIGAFTAAGTVHTAGFVVSLLAGGVAAALTGLLVGFPSLRLRGLYLVFSTLALLVVVQFAFQQLQTDTGALGGYSLGTPTVATLHIVSLRSWYVVLVVAVLFVSAAAVGITSGKLGRAWQAVRGHDIAAGVMGIDVRREKMRAFVVSSFFIGLGGALGAFFLGQVSYGSYGLDLSVSYIAMIIVGGLGSIAGSVIGAIIVTALPFVISNIGTSISGSGAGFLQTNLASVETGVYALIVIAFLMFEPAGVAGLIKRVSSRVTRRSGGAGRIRRATSIAGVEPRGQTPEIADLQSGPLR